MAYPTSPDYITVKLNYKEIYYLSRHNILDREYVILERRLRDIDAIRSDALLEKIGGPGWEKRKSRRETELKTHTSIIPCGPWDNDLDKYHGPDDYPVELPTELTSKGYSAYATRNYYTWTWDGYVRIPPEHPWYSVDSATHSIEDLISNNSSRPPQEVTYFRNQTVGWDHCRSHECCPVPRNSTKPHTTGYVDFKGISKECVAFATWLTKYENLV